MFIIAKNNMTGEKKIIFFTIILLFCSFVFLSYSEQKQSKSIGENGWWAIYFENPQAEDLSFTIENNGKSNNFYWKEAAGNNIIQEASVLILSGEKKTIVPDANNLSGKVIIEITDEAGGKKEIYKLSVSTAGTGL
ncbi:MAG TPA: hypothetical protein DCS28_02610 [Candidatus Moranbacteria bacterium]|nr:hypothetical protein [Candidatus Moranbacteria bacterium]HAT74907.1 hypothetical protein [Candidatus Moranbacteria bacterium]